MLRTLAEMTQADHRPGARRGAGRRHGAGGGLRSSALPATGAVFATSEVRFGIIPSAISPYVIRAIGARQAHPLFPDRRADLRPAVPAELGLAHERPHPTGSIAKVQDIVRRPAAGGAEVPGRRQGADPRRGRPARQRRVWSRTPPAASPACAPRRKRRKASPPSSTSVRPAWMPV
jgi:enoyl-CoA hydratase/carnithine racemase